MESQIVTLEDIEAAAERIAPYIRHTPLLRQEAMGKLLGCDVYLKPEMLQITGAFKLRGAMSKILSLSPQERAKGIITSSSRKPRPGLRYAARSWGSRDRGFAGGHAPPESGQRPAHGRPRDPLGPAVRQALGKGPGGSGAARLHHRASLRRPSGHGRAGHHRHGGTGGPSLPGYHRGAGGRRRAHLRRCHLRKADHPSIRVIGVQAEGNDSYVRSRAAGEVTEAPCTPTVADGLSCRRPGNNPLPIIERYVDELVSVSEAEILQATKLVAGRPSWWASPPPVWAWPPPWQRSSASSPRKRSASC